MLHRFTLPRGVIPLAVVWSLLAPSSLFAQVANPTLDHFRCYPLIFGPESTVNALFLQDQFDVFLGLDLENDAPLLRYFVGQPDRFCNPVEKTIASRGGAAQTTPISDPDAHLTMYRIFREAVAAPALLAVPAVKWKVKVRNQFGEQKLDTSRPVALAVPTWKHEDDLEFPDDLDHFKCYAARGKSVHRKALLEDQFESERVAVLEPRLFCNPTRKFIDAAHNVGIAHPADHLVCYDLSLVTDATFGVLTLVPRVISNQLTGTSTGDILAVTDEDLLCVPSRKLSFAPDKHGGRGDDDDDDDDDEEDEDDD